MVKCVLCVVCMLSSFSCVCLFSTLWTVAHQTPLSMGFSRLEYWSGLPFASPDDLPNPGIEPGSPLLQVDSLPTEPLEKAQISHLEDRIMEIYKKKSYNK